MQDSFLLDVWRDRNPDVKMYTFCRKKPVFTGRRLDYILTDASLTSWIEKVEIIPGFRSDHSAVRINIQPYEIHRGKGYWKLNNRLLMELEFVNLINHIIDTYQTYEKTMQPDDYWEGLKLQIIAEAQNYACQRASDRNFILNQLEEKIKNYVELENQGKLNEIDEQLLERTRCDFNEMIDEKIQGTIFRSGAQYYNEGEKSTKYFFQLEKHKSGSKGMSSVLKPNGDIIYDTKEILQEQKKFYENLYKSDTNINFDYKNTSNITLSNDLKMSLEGLITEQELLMAIKGMKRNKCPGCNGLSLEFYMIFYQKLKHILVKAYNYCYKQGKPYTSALRGIISLIPKKNKDTRIVKNMRPITLLNTDYKFIEKILANRLKPALDSIISMDQKGFMANRRIHCNIRRIFELMQIADNEDLPGLIVSLDFEKCFDRIETSALIKALQYFRVQESYIQWTKLIYNGAMACVTNNGYFSEYFNVTRSVKQGGPNSAYFFLVIAEVLAIELKKNANITGFLIDNLNRILGQYADDLDLYLLGATPHSLNAAMYTIRHFERRSGFKISYEKTTLFRIGSMKYSNDKFVTKEQFLWKNQTNVLGVKIVHNEDDLLKINYQPLLIKAEGILHSWGNRSLSLLGKILIVNTLIASLFVYKMSVLPTIPQQYVKRFNEIIMKFIWNNKKPKIPLKILQANKVDGGLGLVNLAIKDASLRVAWIQFLETDPMVETCAYKQLSDILKSDIWIVNLAPHHVLKIFKKSFWTDVLLAWSKVNYQENICEVDICNQYLWYNSHILRKGTPYIFKEAYQHGLMRLKQIIDVNGNFLPVNLICERYNLTQLQCNSL